MLARLDGDESNPEGPMSFAVSRAGDVYVLDQVSARVVRFGPDGRLLQELPLPGTTFQDIDVVGDGHVVAIDRLVRGTIVVFEVATGATRELQLVGERIPEGGAVTAVLGRDDGVWVELRHEEAVRILDERLEPCPRTTLPGRPSATGGRVLRARLDGRGGAEVLVTTRQGSEVSRVVVDLPTPISRVSWLEDTRQGEVVIGLHVMEEDAASGRIRAEHTEGSVFTDRGQLRARFWSPFVITAWEQLRELDVGADGHLYQLAFTTRGVMVLRFEAPNEEQGR
jgi:hypothetical protein